MLVPISNAPRDYPWGSRTLIAALEGREPQGGPEAEVWFGDHPGAPSLVEDGTGRTLDRWLADEGAEGRLPFLLKLLAAAHPLSIQAHPSKAQAEEGFSREDAAGIPRDADSRNYRDVNHKPELIVAVSDEFRALAGLRDGEASARLVAALGDSSGVRTLRDRLAQAGADVGALVPWLLSDDASAVVTDVLASLGAARSEEFAAELDLARWLCDEVPGDPGIVVALLMNLVTLRRGEGIFVPAGVLHSYFAGLGVEIMASSDNVLRGGFTTKHVDRAELAAVLDTGTGVIDIVHPRAVPEAVGDVAAYPAPVSDFELVRVRVSRDRPAELSPHGIAVVLATNGSVRVDDGDGPLSLRPGQAALVASPPARLRICGAGELFLAHVGA